jgi:lysophospholipase L1-like esterase
LSLRHGIATVALAPLLLLQGRHVRRSVPVLPEPGGQRSGQHGSGPPLRLLVVGDSAAAGVGASTQAEALSGCLVAALAPEFSLSWKLVAFTGATTADMLAQLQQLPAEDFDVAVTSLGVNDVTARRSLTQWQLQQGQFIDLLQTRFRARQIVLSGLPPMHRFPALPQPLRWYVGSRARDFDRALAGLAARRPGCEYLGLGYEMMDLQAMAADGFHPGPRIYALWAAAAARRIRQGRQQPPKELTP